MAYTRAQLLSKKRYNRQKIDEQQKLVNNLDNEIARLTRARDSLSCIKDDIIEKEFNLKTFTVFSKCTIETTFDSLLWCGKSRNSFDSLTLEASAQAKVFRKAVDAAEDRINEEIRDRKNKRDGYKNNINGFTSTLRWIETALRNLTN